MPAPNAIRRRGIRKEFIELNQQKLQAEEFNQLSFKIPEVVQDENSKPQSDTMILPNVQIISETKSTKECFLKIVQLEGLPTKPRLEFLQTSPLSFVNQLKEKVRKLTQEADQVQKKAHFNNKLTDVLRLREDLKLVKQGNSFTSSLRNMGDSVKHNSVLQMLESRFDPRAKITVELYPFKVPEELTRKEEDIVTRIEQEATEIEGTRYFKEVMFVKDGLTVDEVVKYIRTQLGTLLDPAHLKEITFKIDKNQKLIEEFRYQSADDKMTEQDKFIFQRVTEVWKFVQYILDKQLTIDNASIFFNVFSQVQENLKDFEGEMSSFDNVIGQLNTRNNQLQGKLEQSRSRIKVDFIQNISKELTILEQSITKK